MRELLGEFSGAVDTRLDDDTLEIRVGFDFAVTGSFHLPVSAATGLNAPTSAAMLDYDAFLGLQWFR